MYNSSLLLVILVFCQLKIKKISIIVVLEHFFSIVYNIILVTEKSLIFAHVYIEIQHINPYNAELFCINHGDLMLFFNLE